MRIVVMVFFRVLVLVAAPFSIYAQSDGDFPALENTTFSYSILAVDANNIEPVSNHLVAEASRLGATVYALWTPAEKPADAPFAGLADDQLGLMLAWSNEALRPIEAFNSALRDNESITIISNRLFEALYLPAGLEVPTSSGFYVHREEKYSSQDVGDAIRLSQEAWVTWEPHWGVLIVGLFRESDNSSDIVNLNRIAWYPSYAAWLETRNFTEDMESAVRFRERRTLLVPGSGVAIATDRLQP